MFLPDQLMTLLKGEEIFNWDDLRQVRHPTLREPSKYLFPDFIGQYWPITDISVLAYMFADMHVKTLGMGSIYKSSDVLVEPLNEYIKVNTPNTVLDDVLIYQYLYF